MAKVRLILKTFMPWIIFFTLDNYGNLELNIAIIAALAFIIIVNNRSLQQGFLLDWSGLLFFFFLLIVIIIFKQTWFILNAPLLAIYVLALTTWLSVLIKKPLALHFAKQGVTRELWQNKLFYRVNNILTIIWGLTLSSVAMLYSIQQYVSVDKLWLSELLPNTLLFLGLWFTIWFPEWYKRTIIGEWGVISIKNLSNIQTSHTATASLAFRTLGRGSVLIMLPPAYMNMYGWDPELLRLLSKNYQIVILDYPDIGESKLKEGEYTVINIAKALVEFIEQNYTEKVSLLGYSMGGWLAQQIAITHPELIDKLVLIATDVGSPRSTRAEEKTRNILLGQTTADNVFNDDFIKLLFPEQSLKSMKPKLQTIFAAANFAENISNSVILLQQHMANAWYHGSGTYQRLGEIEANTVIIAGAQDKIVNRQNLMLLVNSIPGAKLTEFLDAGHGVIYQHPRSIAECVNNL